MNRYTQRPVLAGLVGALLALGFVAPVAARQTQDGVRDRKEQKEHTDELKAKARAEAQRRAEKPSQPRHAVAREQGPRVQAGHRDQVVRRNKEHTRARQLRSRQQTENHDHQARGQADRRESMARQAERREQIIRRSEKQSRVQQLQTRQQAENRQLQAREQADRRESVSREQAQHREKIVPRIDEHRRIEQQRHDRRQRLSEQQQRHLIEEQRERAQAYRRQVDAQQSQARQRAYNLQQQRRMAQYRYQQDYYRRLRQQQARWTTQRYDYYNDPFFYTPASYRYGYGGQHYETNRYGADLLRQAVRHGYREGLEAGRADRMDGWRPDYRNAYAYQDANYGYNGYYVRQNAYNHYFRQGFQRGYEDGYYSRYRHGNYDNGSASILPAVLAVILGLQLIN